MVYFGKFNILKTKVTACDYDWLIKEIFKKLNKKFIVAPVASHPITLAYLEKNIQKILDKIDVVVPDSQYIRWSLKLLYDVKLEDRIYGPELFLRLLKKTEKKNLKVFLIGNNLTFLVKKLKNNFPKLRVSDFLDLKFKKINGEIILDINNKLSKSKIDIIFIGIGSPNQHKLAAAIKKRKPIICVGAAFDFAAGIKKQAPKLMQKTGLEWLFRFIYEPKKLWKRYLINGPLFILIIFIYLMKIKLKKLFQ